MTSPPAAIQFPSPTGSIYVEPSAHRRLEPGEHIENLFGRTMSGPYVLQRLSERAWWVEAGIFATLFYVGNESVLLMDPLENSYDAITAAVASVTDKPISTMVYTHFHADHIGDSQRYVEADPSIRIIASDKTAAKLRAVNSVFPPPTETVAWPRGSFAFETLTVELHGFQWAAHSDDHSAWLLRTERIVHCPDLMNPDQLPFWRFTGNEQFLFADRNLAEVRDLEWDFLSAGHGNVGSRADVDFELTYYTDMRNAVVQAFTVHPITDFINPADGAHSAWFPGQLAAVAASAVDRLRPTYGHLYGFEASAPPNAELVAFTVFAFR